MAQILGTDGNYDARGKLTIIRDPIDDGKQEHRFYIALLAALAFSDGFYLDAAWLVDSPLFVPAKNQNSSLRRLLAKGYIRLTSRIPREDLLSSMPDELRHFVANHQAWSWPTPYCKPHRIEKDEWVVVERPQPVQSLDTIDGKLASLLIPEDILVCIEEMNLGLPSDFSEIVANLNETLSDSAVAGYRESTITQEILATTKVDINQSLEGGELCKILGGQGEGSQTLKENRRLIQEELTNSASDLSERSAEIIGGHASSTAKVLGFESCSQSDEERVAISLSDAIGFLLA